jgi:hypothetical protein
MRSRYVLNPACFCDWCRNNGTNPTPGNPAALGYDEPHIPAPHVAPSFLEHDAA